MVEKVLGRVYATLPFSGIGPTIRDCEGEPIAALLKSRSWTSTRAEQSVSGTPCCCMFHIVVFPVCNTCHCTSLNTEC